MKIKIICLGKIKEKYLVNGINEYLKRLQAYSKVEIIEINEYKLMDNPNTKEINIALEEEALRINKFLNKDDYIIVLDIDGKSFDNYQFSDIIKKANVNGFSTISFVIGSSHGLAKQIKEQANLRWSFSKLTFPHQLMRLILVEQIYRTFRIINNEPYHK
ncbi:MAG: 23S rRNA (pseudouridine(1915)-N(3))-methyltransferase RlmH [Bacilli bacterium]|jgi:23S rRNA (pseudouridine1915-N3)-methyltransferase|nr:23S rRNA (pseudouridine(1915)-N(3))-methyltransferase RlmH [Bacilli bacterium]